MSSKSGDLSRMADFIEAILPASQRDGKSHSMIGQILSFMQDFDRAQQEKGFVYSLRTKKDGFSLYHNGSLLFFVLPRRGSLRVLHYHGEVTEIDRFLENKEPRASRVDSSEQGASLWSIPMEHYSVIVEFLTTLERDEDEQAAEAQGRRPFSKEVKEAAFKLSAAGGYECPGYSIAGKQRQEPHRFNPAKDGYHLDHVVPFSRGGPSKAWNVRVLCNSCNLKKSNAPPPPMWGNAIS